MNTTINRLLKLLATSALLLIAAQPVLAFTIVGSRHDFTLTGPIAANRWTGDRICVACHAPHNADVTVGMLWSHTNTAGAGFQPYPTGGTMNASPSASMSNGTKLCLSCHDGSLAPDSFVTGAATAAVLAGTHKIGPDLRGSHPIGFTYNLALATADQSLQDPAALIIAGSTGAGNNKSGSITTVLLGGTGVMECSSCHDVHNTFTAINTPGTGLVKLAGTGTVKTASTIGAQLCLACHNK